MRNSLSSLFRADHAINGGSSTPVETKHRPLAYSSHAARAILSDSQHIGALLSFLQGRVRMTLAMQVLHEPYAHLYVGDYFADTLDLSAHEHCALRLLLLETWVHGPVGHVRLARVAGLAKEEWQAIKPAVLPLLRGVQPRILDSLNYIRTFDGQRLPSADWHIVRSIVMERDRYACTYCGSDKQLEADHILPLSRGGSNDFVNLATACRSCNLSKGSKAVEDWGAPGRLRFSSDRPLGNAPTRLATR
jgi:HNH endonuclease/Protein of unknown function (DUF1376)